jgi:hypothetical protein
MAIYRGRGVINKHGTLRTATANAVFFVFDMLASDWADVLSKLVKWLGLINGFGQAAYTTAKWASALPQTKWAPEVTGHLKAKSVSLHGDWQDNQDGAGFCCQTERQQQPKQ